MKEIVILTDSRYASPKASEIDEYVSNILLEGDILEKAFSKYGIKTTRSSWSDPKVKWSDHSHILIREVWDYHERFNEFFDWFNKCPATFINSKDIVHWNIDKHYLFDLEEKGIAIPPSKHLKKGTNISLTELFRNSNWEKAILKPCISGAARDTYVIEEANLPEFELKFSDLISKEDFLFQEFQKEIKTRGEISLMFMAGKYTHCILKKAKAGDFRVQDDFGGSVENFEPSTAEIELGERCLELISHTPDYARVDIMWDVEGKPMISELELIEPELWFRENEEAALTLAEHINARYF